MSNEPIKGRAHLLVDKCVVERAPVKIETPKYGHVVWGMVEVKELFDLWKSYLLLPEGYEMIGVYFDAIKQMWSIILESADLPQLKPNMEPRHLFPTYWVDENGKVSIQEMKLMDW